MTKLREVLIDAGVGEGGGTRISEWWLLVVSKMPLKRGSHFVQQRVSIRFLFNVSVTMHR